MATLVQNIRHTLTEVATYYVDFAPDIPTGVTMTSATATHTPPSGTASTPVVVRSGTQVAVSIGPFSVKGDHLLSIFAHLDNSDKVPMHLKLNVRM